MARLSLRLFGGFLLRADARGRAVPARKAQAMLAYLAVRAGRAHARETLTGLLWSDAAEAQARQSLRQTLVQVRRALAGGARRCLVTQGDTVTLDPSAVDLDVARFEDLTCKGTVDSLETAVALYRGQFLDGVHVDEAAFEDRMITERARLHELALDALRRLVALYVKSGRLEQAAQSAVRLVALDPRQEDVHRTLMQLYVRQGRRAAALRQYQTCVGVLQRELGVEPEPETRQIYQDILQHRAPSTAPQDVPARSRTSPRRTARAAPDVPRPEPPLVGRVAELARLTQALDEADRGTGRTVVVLGEAGIGKTRLVEELAAAVLR